MAALPPPSASSAPPPALPSLVHEIGPDGFARESPVIAYTEKRIEAEQLQLKRYIQENYSKIRDVERELENVTLELKLTSGPKKAALEHIRKKIELSTERIRLAKIKEEEARKVWEAAVQAVKDEETIKQKLCDDLNHLVQESTTTQYTRLEELKRRLEALGRGAMFHEASEEKPIQSTYQNVTAAEAPKQPAESARPLSENSASATNHTDSASDARNGRPTEVKEKKRIPNTGRGKGSLILPKGRGHSGTGWTGAGFDVDSGT